MDIQELAREVILEHSRNPRNFGKPERYTHHAYCKNPNCGDELTLYLNISTDGKIKDIAFEGEGCAISKASSSLLTERIKGCNRCEIPAALAELDALIAPSKDIPNEGEIILDLENFRELDALRGVRNYPARIACAQLAWQALDKAIR